MTPNEKKLEYPWAERLPDPGHALAITDTVRWVRLPLPFALDHVNVWLIRDRMDGRDGWCVIDCGVARDQVKDLWAQVFDNALDGLPVLRVIVTHMHPDHVGLAQWLCERWQAPLYMTMTDYMTARLWSLPPEVLGTAGPNGPAAARHFEQHGLQDPEALEQIRARANYYPDLVPAVPDRFIRLMHGDRLTIGAHEWQVIVGYGHAPEHASFYCQALNILISGDMLLPRISTNISVFNYEPEANPLPYYLRSLLDYDSLPADTLVLPSHGRVFRGMHERIAQQLAHHQARLDEVLDACEQPMTAADIVPIMFRRELDVHQLAFAMGEALAHLHALWHEGRLIRTEDESGVYRFQRYEGTTAA